MKFIFFVIMICLFFSGCGVGVKGRVYNNISEMVEFVVVGSDDKMAVSLMCGTREVDYKIDGISTEPVPYGVLTLSIIEAISSTTEVDYVLFVGTNKYQGEFQKNPYDATWVADIKKIVDKKDNISIDIFIAGEKTALKLKAIDYDWVVEPRGIVDILVKEYNAELKELISGGVFEGEVYIKLVNDNPTLLSRYYYYVSVVDRKGGSFNLLISPTTKDILASNNMLWD